METSALGFASSLNSVLCYVGLIFIIYGVIPCCSKNNSSQFQILAKIDEPVFLFLFTLPLHQLFFPERN